MDRERIGAKSRDRVEDGISAFGPHERLGFGVVGLNESSDVGLEFLDTAMDAALDLLVGEQRKPAFDLIEPGGAGRREVHVITRMAGEPGRDRRRLVGGVIVEHKGCRDRPAPPARAAPGSCGIRPHGDAGSSAR